MFSKMIACLEAFETGVKLDTVVPTLYIEMKKYFCKSWLKLICSDHQNDWRTVRPVRSGLYIYRFYGVLLQIRKSFSRATAEFCNLVWMGQAFSSPGFADRPKNC